MLLSEVLFRRFNLVERVGSVRVPSDGQVMNPSKLWVVVRVEKLCQQPAVYLVLAKQIV